MPYDLVGPDDSLIFPNGLVPKERFSNAQALLAEGQRIIDQRVVDGIRVVELEYTNAGEPWWQSHWLVSWGDSRLLLITAQAPLVHAAVTAKAAELVAGSAWPTGVPLPQ